MGYFKDREVLKDKLTFDKTPKGDEKFKMGCQGKEYSRLRNITYQVLKL